MVLQHSSSDPKEDSIHAKSGPEQGTSMLRTEVIITDTPRPEKVRQVLPDRSWRQSAPRCLSQNSSLRKWGPILRLFPGPWVHSGLVSTAPANRSTFEGPNCTLLLSGGQWGGLPPRWGVQFHPTLGWHTDWSPWGGKVHHFPPCVSKCIGFWGSPNLTLWSTVSSSAVVSPWNQECHLTPSSAPLSPTGPAS